MAQGQLSLLMAPGALTLCGQPIMVRARDGWRPYALEILSRGPAQSNFFDAEVLFEYVRRKRAEPEIDRLCAAAALAAVGGLPGDHSVSLNVHASTLGRDAGFPDHLQRCADAARFDPRRLIVEIVEHAPAWDGESFRRSIAALKAGGLRVALDDVGTGHSNFRMMLECEPDYFKLDRCIVQRAAADLRRRAVVESLALLAARMEAAVIAEGVEAADDIEAVSASGVDLVQGFYFSRPRPLDAFARGWPDEAAFASPG